MPILITTADAKVHLRVYHTEDDSYIATLVQAVCEEWESITHQTIGQDLATSQSHYYTEEPEDGFLRAYFNPVDTATLPTIVTEDPVSTISPTEAWIKLDGYAIYPISTSLTESATYSYPLTFTYSISTAFNSIIKQALLLRVGYFYSYRGDDPSPPDMTGWLMLAARYRTGALL